MGDITIKTDHKYRDTITWLDLTPKEQKDFDWLLTSDTFTTDEAEFIRYKGNVYCMSEFMRLEGHAGQPSEFSAWQGYSNDTYFSGILVRYNDEGQVMIGYFYS